MLFRSRVKELNCTSFPISGEIYSLKKFNNKHIDFSYDSSYYDIISFRLPTCAIYQMQNCALALKCFEVLEPTYDLRDHHIKSILSKVTWPGRLEEILDHVFVDGAHNVEGIEAFLLSVKKMKTTNRNILMFSVVQDKNYQEMIQYIVNSHLFTDYVIVPVEDKRGTDVSEIEDTFYKYIDRDLDRKSVV